MLVFTLALLLLLLLLRALGQHALGPEFPGSLTGVTNALVHDLGPLLDLFNVGTLLLDVLVLTPDAVQEESLLLLQFALERLFQGLLLQPALEERLLSLAVMTLDEQFAGVVLVLHHLDLVGQAVDEDLLRHLLYLTLDLLLAPAQQFSWL